MVDALEGASFLRLLLLPSMTTYKVYKLRFLFTPPFNSAGNGFKVLHMDFLSYQIQFRVFTQS